MSLYKAALCEYPPSGADQAIIRASADRQTHPRAKSRAGRLTGAAKRDGGANARGNAKKKKEKQGKFTSLFRNSRVAIFTVAFADTTRGERFAASPIAGTTPVVLRGYSPETGSWYLPSARSRPLRSLRNRHVRPS